MAKASRWKDALRSFDAALKHSPDHAEARLGRARQSSSSLQLPPAASRPLPVTLDVAAEALHGLARYAECAAECEAVERATSAGAPGAEGDLRTLAERAQGMIHAAAAARPQQAESPEEPAKDSRAGSAAHAVGEQQPLQSDSGISGELEAHDQATSNASTVLGDMHALQLSRKCCDPSCDLGSDIKPSEECAT
eukprot:tig00021365_g20830.t1